MSKLETNTIDTISGTSNLTIGSTNSSTVTFESGSCTNHNYPAFEAYLENHQSIADNAQDKILNNIEVFDTDNCYDNSTNYRFTPNKAGKYLVYAGATFDDGAGNLRQCILYVYKNGSQIASAKLNYDNSSTSEGEGGTPHITTVIDMNGSSDYLEVFGEYDSNDGGTANIQGNVNVRSTNFGAYRLGA
jgi:hypothetical protein